MGRLSGKAFGDDLFFSKVNEHAKAYVRRTDPDTSHAAARSVDSEVARLHQIVINAINAHGDNGANCSQICDHTGLPWNTISPRLAPLRVANLIAAKTKDGEVEKRPGPSGRKQIVWIVK